MNSPEAFKPENERTAGDEELIELAIEAAEDNDTIITDAAARVIASKFHGGIDVNLSVFVSTGQINALGMYEEIQRNLRHLDGATQLNEEQWLTQLGMYVISHGSREPQEGWACLWLNRSSHRELEDKFKYIRDEELIDRIELGDSEETQDERDELSRRLGKRGIDWYWLGDEIHTKRLEGER